MNSAVKTIAFFTPRMEIGGAETYIINKAKWLIDHNYNVVIFSAGGVFVDNLPTHVKHVRFDYIDVPVFCLKRETKKSFLNFLKDELKNNQVDLIEAFDIFPIVYALYIFQIAGIPFFINILAELGFIKNPMVCLTTIFMNNKKLYYTINNGINQSLQKITHHKLNNCQVVPLPIVYNKDLIPQNDNYVLSVCRMSKEKMYIKYLIKDFYKVVSAEERYNDLKLIIVGDGELYREVKLLVDETNRLNKKDNIKMQGFVVGDALQELFANCLVYVGMGTTLLNAASYGKPAIISGFEENTMEYGWGYWGFIENDSIGQVNSSMNKDSFVNYILKIIGNEDFYNKVSLLCKKQIEDKYSIDSIMKIWENQYLLITNKYDKYLKNHLKRYYIILRSIEIIHRSWRLIRGVTYLH